MTQIMGSPHDRRTHSSRGESYSSAVLSLAEANSLPVLVLHLHQPFTSSSPSSVYFSRKVTCKWSISHHKIPRARDCLFRNLARCRLSGPLMFLIVAMLAVIRLAELTADATTKDPGSSDLSKVWLVARRERHELRVQCFAPALRTKVPFPRRHLPA